MRWLIALGLAAAGCQPSGFVPAPPEAKSALISARSGERIRDLALALDGTGSVDPGLPAEEGMILELAFSTLDLSELVLAPGLIPEPRERPFPACTLAALRRHQIEGGSVVEAAPLEVLPLTLARLPAIDPRACAALGRCVEPPAGCGEEQLICKTTCTPPAIQAPARASPPSIACGSGWGSSVDPEGLPRCDPPARQAPPCAQPGGCPSSCPAADFSAEQLALSGALYVLPGAPGPGDGSAARPYSSLDAAIRSGRPERVIALARGRAVESIDLSGGWTVRGACPEESTIQGSIQAGGALSLVALTVEGTVQVAATAQIRESRILTPESAGLRLLPGASADLLEVEVATSSAAGVGWIELDRAALTASAAFVGEIRAVASTVSVDSALILGRLRNDLGRTSIRRSLFRRASVVLSGGTSQLHQLRLDHGAIHLSHGHQGEVLDVAVAQPPRFGPEHEVGCAPFSSAFGVRLCNGAGATGQRWWIWGYGAGVHLSRGFRELNRLDLEDLTAIDTDVALSVEDEGSATVRRILARRAGATDLTATRFDPVVIEDLIVEEVAGTLRSGVRLAGEAPLTLRRARITQQTGAAIDLTGATVAGQPLSFEDVEIVGGPSTLGIRLDEIARARFDDLRVVGTSTAVALRASSELEVVRGEIDAPACGVAADASSTVRLRSVRFAQSRWCP